MENKFKIKTSENKRHYEQIGMARLHAENGSGYTDKES